MNRENQFLYLLILNIIVILVEAKIETKYLTLKNENLNVEQLKEETNFQVDIETSNLKNFLKIVAEGRNYKDIANHTNHIISFYKQDSNYKDRKQLSQSLTGRTVMWLTKEQLKNIFYFNVECSKSNCDYSV